jgi:SNF2 family DNA or RNA helicase
LRAFRAAWPDAAWRDGGAKAQVARQDFQEDERIPFFVLSLKAAAQNGLVHKFVCRGTVEEKINAPIESKGGLSRELLDGSAEVNLTELGNDEILRRVSLGLHTAMKD